VYLKDIFNKYFLKISSFFSTINLMCIDISAY
jgi:hypothetical protein